MLVHAWIFNAITRIMHHTLAQRLCGHFCRRFSCASLINHVRVYDSWNPTTRYHLLIFYALWTQKRIEASCQRSHDPCRSRREKSERNVTQEIKRNYVGRKGVLNNTREPHDVFGPFGLIKATMCRIYSLTKKCIPKSSQSEYEGPPR